MSAPRDAPPDGLQAARTGLAWQRTLLSLAVGALVSLRLLPTVLGDWAIAVGIGGVAIAAALWIASRSRQRAVGDALAGRGRTPGGGLLAGLALLVAAGAALGLLLVLAAR